MKERVDLERAPTFRVADHDGRIVGVAEWRMIDERLFLNTIATALRGRGIGSLLLRDGLEHWTSLDAVELDVFASMPDAIQWYERLGFSATRRSEWAFYPPPLAQKQRGSTNGNAAISRDLDAERVQWTNRETAASNHNAYNVSMLDLMVKNTPYRVGRLGSDFFRITDRETLQNRDLREFLYHLDPSRHFAYRAAHPPSRDPFTGLEGQRIAMSTRMQASRKTVLQRVRCRQPRA